MPGRSWLPPRVSATLLSLSMVACGSDPVAPQDQLTRRLESAHFVYLFAPGDQVDTLFQERHYVWVTARLDLDPTTKPVYHKYRDRAHLRRLTGKATNGFAEEDTYHFHSIWPQDNHEYVHTLWTQLVGLPPALFTEGVAVAHHGASVHGDLNGDPNWSGTSVHVLARRHRSGGRLPDLSDLVESLDFRRLDPEVTYPVAGSFVRYLIDEEGIEPLKELSRRIGVFDASDRIRDEFEGVYGASLDLWWDRWLDFVGGG